MKVYGCPSPDCNESFDYPSNLSEHVNEDHPGEYKQPGWPDTEVSDGE